MKEKLIDFCVALGVPASALTTQGAGCSGVCGSCGYSCTPSVALVLLLLGKLLYRKACARVVQHE